MNGYKTGNTLTCLILTSYSVSGTLGRYHCYIHILRRCDAAKVYIKSVSEHKHIARLQIRLNILLIKISLKLIIDQYHDDISFLGSLGCGIYLEALRLSLSPALRALVQTDDDVAA